MHPVLWSVEVPLLGLVTFPAYFTGLTIAFALATLLAWRDAPRVGINPDKIIDLSLYIIISSIVGSRILHVLFDGHFVEYLNICLAPETVPVPAEVLAAGQVPSSCTTDAQCGPHYLCNMALGICHVPRDCLLALKIWRGGLVYYGGFLAACAASLLFARANRISLWKVADLYGYGIALGLFFGRIGCFYNGCCYGKTTLGPLGVVFPRGGAAWRQQMELGLIAASAEALPVHPTQLYSALLNLGVFFWIYFLTRPNKRFDGQVFFMFILLKAVTRYLVEFLRDDERGVFLGGLVSTSQLISLGLGLLAIAMMRRLARAAAEPTPEAGPEALGPTPRV